MKESNPKVAVIVPVYNTAKYLAQCLDSLLEQTYKNFTIFAVNDGSTDSSELILNKFKEKDSRIIVLNKENGGAASARNLALKRIEDEATYRGVCFVDSDDYVKPRFLELFVTLADKYKADHVICGWDYFDKTGVVERSSTPYITHPTKILSQNDTFCHFTQTKEWSKLRSKTLSYGCANLYFSAKIVKGLRFNEDLKRAEDQEFRMRAIARIQKCIVSCEINYMYRIRKSSLSHHKNVILDDLLFSIKLIEDQQEFSDFGRHTIEHLCIKHWWRCFKAIVATQPDPLGKEIFKKCSRSLLEYRKTHPDANFKTKGVAKLYLYHYAQPILKLFVAVHQKKQTSHTTQNAYD